jgi:hypothetical protein
MNMSLLLFAIDLYRVNIDMPFIVSIAYIIPLLICVLLREFVHGWLRYLLAAAFTASFGALWYLLQVDNSPWQFIIPALITFGAAAGLWGWLHRILDSLKKL